MQRFLSTSKFFRKASLSYNFASIRPFSSTIFDKIVSKELPSDIVYENDKILAFRDVNPQAPIHILIIPKSKENLSGLGEANESNQQILGHMMVKCAEIAQLVGIKDNGFRIVINHGKNGCQSVDHIHIHLLGGEQLTWPPGTQKKISKTYGKEDKPDNYQH